MLIICAVIFYLSILLIYFNYLFWNFKSEHIINVIRLIKTKFFSVYILHFQISPKIFQNFAFNYLYVSFFQNILKISSNYYIFKILEKFVSKIALNIICLSQTSKFAPDFWETSSNFQKFA